jgi:hypothetical protein
MRTILNRASIFLLILVALFWLKIVLNWAYWWFGGSWYGPLGDFPIFLTRIDGSILVESLIALTVVSGIAYVKTRESVKGSDRRESL